MKRVFDLLLAICAIMLLAVPMCLLALLVRLTSDGPALYWSDRVGKGNKIYRMPKYRTMKTEAPVVATHLLGDPARYLTPIGHFLRKTSLDELPQLWSILIGEMSFVGPRPALFNQYDLISLRTKCGVHELRPGLTGWAQINGRDDITVEKKAAYDRAYLDRMSLVFDLKIILITISKVVKREGVSH